MSVEIAKRQQKKNVCIKLKCAFGTHDGSSRKKNEKTRENISLERKAKHEAGMLRKACW